MAHEKVPGKIKELELDLSQVTRTKSILNQNQIQKLWNSTSKKFQYSRPAKGGGNWTYVKVSYVRKVLDSVFGFDWDFDIETSVEEAFSVAKVTGGIVLKGTLLCRVIDDAGRIRTIKKTQFGRSDVKWKSGKKPEDTDNPVPLDIGNDFKAAASDCLKKCASLVGVASDIYEADEFMEILITDSSEEKATKSAGRLTKKLQKETIKKDSSKVGGQNEQK
jgi:hypothetical protein